MCFGVLMLVLLIILTSGRVISYLLKDKIESKLNNLIGSILLLPGIPVIWLMSKTVQSDSNNVLQLYFPLIISLIVILVLLINIVRFNKK